MKLLLTILLIAVAFLSTAAGMIMVIDPTGSVLELSPADLKNSLFKDYLIPGILLIASISSVSLMALSSQFINRNGNNYNWSMGAGIVTIAWAIVQTMWLQISHWTSLIFICIGFFIIILAYQLKGKWAA